MTMARRELSGQRFGRLVVLAYAGDRQWHCQCDCGRPSTAKAHHLVSGDTQSCGCRRASLLLKHGLSRTPEYKIWQGAIRRCNNPAMPHYHRYGGRGIAVCDRWRESFENFLADMGPRPTPLHTLDRVDGDGPYAPENCRWATRKEQAQNTSRSRFVCIDGMVMTVSQACDRLGLNYGTVSKRLSRGMSVDRAFAR